MGFFLFGAKRKAADRLFPFGAGADGPPALRGSLAVSPRPSAGRSAPLQPGAARKVPSRDFLPPALRPAPAFKESGASQGIAVGLRPPPGSKKGAKKKLKKNQKKSVRPLTVFSKSARFSFTALKHGRSSLEQAGKGRER